MEEDDHDAEQLPLVPMVEPESSGESDEDFLDPPEPEEIDLAGPADQQFFDVVQAHDSDSETGSRSSVSRFSRLFRRHDSVPFNRSLPAAHLYLGADLEELPGGQILYDADTILSDVVLFPLTHLILMPGQTLPLQYLHPRSVAMFRRIIAKHKIFGAIKRTNDGFSKYGTLAQVVAYYETTEEGDESDSFKIRAIGRQRFRLIETNRQLDGTHCSKVQVLADYMPGQLMNYVTMASLDRYHRLGRLTSSKRLEKLKYFGYHLIGIPAHAFRYHDTQSLIQQLVNELCEWYDRERMEAMSKSPIHLSYWIAANLPIGDAEKMKLFSMDSALQRLRSELDLMRRCTQFCCRECGQVIGLKVDVFTMSVEGPLSAYVNPHGIIHETLTLRKAQGIELIGGQTTANSWFPGYAWRILQCSQCHSHIGWRFKAAKNYLDPNKFWGITRASIMPMMVADEDGCG